MLEAVAFLNGQQREPRLLEVTRMLCAEMLLLGKLAPDQEQALRQVDESLDSGAALERFSRMVRALGGPADFAQQAGRYLPPAPVQVPVKALQSGWIGATRTRDIGLLVIGLGGGRRKASDAIDPRVGFSQVMALGSAVEAGQTLAVVHAADAAGASAAARGLLGCIDIVDQAPALAPILKARIAY
jgi:thymidine phosphorylase